MLRVCQTSMRKVCGRAMVRLGFHLLAHGSNFCFVRGAPYYFARRQLEC